MKRFLLCILLFFPCLLLFGEWPYESIGVYKIISSPNGLRVREEPSLNSKVIEVFPYGLLHSFILRTKTKDTIDGISDYWYGFRAGISGGYHWVFGGYLVDKLASEPHTGYWREEGTAMHWIFFEGNRGDFARGPRQEYGNGYIIWFRHGTFEKRGNNRIFFIFLDSELDDTSRPFHRREAEIIFSNIDRIILKFNTEEIILNRIVNF
ncbi:MAG: SH3 domain-containing protein [Treponema sp.]|jgi:hypothetical protein|nr:SH3 domain-containing protein [Treponema sp.]